MKNTPELNDDDFAALAKILGDEIGSIDAPPPPSREPELEQKSWMPDLNPTQLMIFNDPAENVLGHSEKGTGKTVVFGHKMVRHAYEVKDALIQCITPMIRTGNDGIWYDLETLVLPAWQEGIGLEFTKSKLDPLTKDRHRLILNRWGTWSKIVLMSIPHASQVEARVAGPAPSMVYVDELDKCECTDNEYYKFPAAQLGRRRDTGDSPMQYLASCNPKGPSHWVYKVFFENCTKTASGEPWTVEMGGVRAKDGIVRDPNYAVYHVPIEENLHRLPKGYYDRLKRIFGSDPIRWKRLIEGIWVDEPTGEGLFAGYYSISIHKKGDAVRGLGLEPKPGFPIYIGYDIGQVWQGITFLQCLPTATKNVWIIFDECDHLNEKVIYKMLALEVIQKMRYWRRRIGFAFQYCHISDESALNQWRPGGEGGYDAWEFEKEFNKVLGEFGRIGGDGSVEPAKLLGCPKGPGSIESRVRLVQSKLYQEELFISATCENTIDCMSQLERDKNDPGKPKRSKWVHKFDSFSYPMFKLEIGNDPRLILPLREQAPSVRIYAMGGN